MLRPHTQMYMPTNERQKDVESHIIGSHAHKLIIWKYDLSTLMHANDSIIWTKTKNHGIMWKAANEKERDWRTDNVNVQSGKASIKPAEKIKILVVEKQFIKGAPYRMHVSTYPCIFMRTKAINSGQLLLFVSVCLCLCADTSNYCTVPIFLVGTREGKQIQFSSKRWLWTMLNVQKGCMCLWLLIK